jgi:hypothetical protein
MRRARAGGLDWAHAASIPLAGLTAWQALAALRLSSGDTLLVNGPRGAVGGFAVQLAIHYGAQVVSTGPADAALDVVGGRTARETFAAVRDGGRYVTVVPEFWVPGGQFTPARWIKPVVLSVEPMAGSSPSCPKWRLPASSRHGSLTSCPSKTQPKLTRASPPAASEASSCSSLDPAAIPSSSETDLVGDPDIEHTSDHDSAR